MAGVLNDTGPSQVCGTRPPARTWANFYIIYNSDDASLKHILKGCPLLCHQYVPSHRVILDFPKKSTRVFHSIPSVLKHKEDLQMCVHSQHLKRHCQEKENGPSSHYYYYCYVTFALFCITGTLKNRHHEQKEERDLRCIRGAIVWTPGLSITFLLKRKQEKKHTKPNMWVSQS